MKKRKSLFFRFFLIGLLVTFVPFMAIRLISEWVGPWPGSNPAVSAVQIRRVGEAVGAYAAREGGRPGDLNAIVTAGLLSQDDLYDEHRKKRPVVELYSGVEISPPDVIYFPALRASDPADCVLLCTLLLREKGEKFHVIYNDGRYAALTARELVMALNHTYEHIGEVLATESEVRSQESGDRSQEIEVRSQKSEVRS